MAIIRNVNNSGERYTRLQLYLTDGVKQANEEHHEILKLCRERDTAGACNLLRQHIQYAGQSLKEALQEQRAAAQSVKENGSPRAKYGPRRLQYLSLAQAAFPFNGAE